METSVKSNSIKVFSNDTVFCMINGQLQECKLLKTFFIKDQNDTFLVQTIVRLPDGTTDQENVNYNTAFDTPQDYEANQCATTSGWEITRIRYSMYADKSIVGNILGGTKSTFYTFEKGEPQLHELELKSFYFDYTSHHWKTKELPSTEIYATREDAISYNMIEVVNGDGIKSEYIGANKLIQLDDDQLELIRQLEDIMAKLVQNDVYLLADTSDNYMAYNMRHVADQNMNYGEVADVPEDEQSQYEKVDRWGQPFRVNINYPQWSEDYDMFIKRKAE